MIDLEARTRFAEELDRNFSVIAPAGVGKTTAIVQRIAQMGRLDPERSAEMFSRLVVVTYTNKSAREMQLRAREEILRLELPPFVLNHFNRAFFGTIHSFCLKLLRQNGHHIGLPGGLELLEDDSELWNAFSKQMGDLGAPEVLKYISLFDVFKLARELKPSVLEPRASESPPVSLKAILDCPLSRQSKAQKNGERGKELALAWQERKGFRPVPVFEKGGKAFVENWRETFEPLSDWVSREAVRLALKIARDFRQYRISRGLLTYEDQIETAVELLRHPVAGRKLREKKNIIILDEAQDTGVDQFEVLLSLARQGEGNGALRPGAFSMVGDPQQSIYGERIDIPAYQNIRAELEKHGVEELHFHVTFRCQRAIVQAVNNIAPSFLNGLQGQSEYEVLQPAPSAETGQVICWRPSARQEENQNPKNKKPRAEYPLSRHEAGELVAWMQEKGLDGLQARDWSEVAVLLPNKRWFEPFAECFRAAGVDYQIQSHRDKMEDVPFYLWLTALGHIVVEPADAFEIAGVLRELFGLPDAELAEFVRGEPERLQIIEPSEGESSVAAVLNNLCELRQRVLKLPLRDAVERLSREVWPRTRCLPHGGEEELGGVLCRSAEMEREGETLRGWVAAMKRGLTRRKPEGDVRAGAIQLMTCHKAKGLEWDAVVLPFLCRNIKTRSDSYPKVLRQFFGELPEVWVDGLAKGKTVSVDGFPMTWEEKNKLRRRQERERLLYVALTRARHTLVLVEDSALFGDSNANSFSASMPAPGRWEVDSADEGGAPVAPAVVEPVCFSWDEKPIVEEDWQQAKRLPFVERILPHQLALHSRDGGSANENYPEQRLLTLPKEDSFAAERAEALEYGVWWHRMCEKMPWYQSFSVWQKHFDAWKPRSPFPDRAKTEWERFLGSELAEMLNKPDYIVHTELPVLHLLPENRCVEGIIDLAVWNQREWLIVDWKTDQNAGKDELIQHYARQLAAYRDALETLTSAPVQTSIYTTVGGLLISCDKENH